MASTGMSRRLFAASGVGAAAAAYGAATQPAAAKKCKRSETRTLQISATGTVTVTPTTVEFRFLVAQVYNSDGTVTYITDPKDLIPEEGDSYEVQINGYAEETGPNAEFIDLKLVGMVFKVLAGVVDDIGDKLLLSGGVTLSSLADGTDLRMDSRAAVFQFESPLMNSKI